MNVLYKGATRIRRKRPSELHHLFCLDRDVENLELDDAAGRLCVDHVADLVAEESLSDGRGARNLTGAEIRFAFRNDGVLHLGATFTFFISTVERICTMSVAEFRRVDDLGCRDGSFELVDLVFENSLCFFGGVVFRVLGEVAFCRELQRWRPRRPGGRFAPYGGAGSRDCRNPLGSCMPWC